MSRALQDYRARGEALYQYAAVHDRFAEREQLAVIQHQALLAAINRNIARIAIRAWLAERDDPEPEREP